MKTVTTDQAVLGSLIAIIRSGAGLKQGELAEKIGINQSTWSRIEKGETALSAFQLYALSTHLAFSIDDLFKCFDYICGIITKNHGIIVISNEKYKKLSWGDAKFGTTKNYGAAIWNIIDGQSKTPEDWTLPIFGAALGFVVAEEMTSGLGPLIVDLTGKKKRNHLKNNVVSNL